MGKETGGKKMEDPHSLKSNEMAECSFAPQQPLVADSFKNCEGLSRVAFTTILDEVSRQQAGEFLG